MSLEIAALVILGLTVLIGGLVLMRSSDSESGPSGGSRTDRSPKTDQPVQKQNWLIGQSQSVRDQSFHVGQRTVTVGRGMGNFIQIKDENASRKHAQLDGSAQGMTIMDMGSSNGTRVDGHDLESNSPYELGEGNEIEIGDTTFVYRRRGDYEDQALTGSRDAGVSDKETQALGAIGGGDFQQEVEDAVRRAGGDYEQAAEEVGLEPDMIRRIVED